MSEEKLGGNLNEIDLVQKILNVHEEVMREGVQAEGVEGVSVEVVVQNI